VSDRVPVLYLAPWVDLGGADKGTIDWFTHLDRERFAPSLICTQPSPNRWLDRVEPYAEELWVLPELMAGREFAEFVLGFIASRGVRVVHVMHSRLGYDLLPDIRLLPDRPATCVQFHLLEPDRSGYVPYVVDRYIDLVDAFSVVSRHLAQALRDEGVPDGRIEVIPLGVDAEREWDPARVEPYELGEGAHLLWPGRMVEQKDPLLAVEAAAGLAGRDLDCTLHMVGEGPLEAVARARAKELDLDSRIAWHPPSRELARWYAACDLVLMTSGWEGIPYVVYEALSMQTPVVAPALPGNVELCDEDAGELVPLTAAPEAYAAAIERVLAREDGTAAGQRSRARIRRDYRAEGMAEAHGRLYDRLLALHPAAPAPPAPLPEPLRLPRPSPPERSVAVVIACYEHGHYLPHALASLRAQELPPAQVIVVDDGSRDPGTRAVLDELEGWEELEVVRLPANVGLGPARNAALERVRSSYVLPLDADDALDPSAIATMVGLLEAAPEDVGFVYPNYQHFGTRDDLLTVPAYNLALLRRINYCHASSLFDRRVFDGGLRYRPEREAFEDWELVLDLAERGVRGIPAPGRTLLYRKRGFSLVAGRRFEGISPEDGARLRHPALHDPRHAIKARWAPALSVVALPGEWPAGLLDAQTCVDFEVVCQDDHGWGGPVKRAIGADPDTWLERAVGAATGRWVLVADPGAAPAMGRVEFAEHVIRSFTSAYANTAVALGRVPGRRALAALEEPLPPGTTVAAVGWERTPEHPWEPVELGATGDPLTDLLLGLQAQRPVRWWAAG
jgi:glycosyltransferase involved in cell wall biosynthesis